MLQQTSPLDGHWPMATTEQASVELMHTSAQAQVPASAASVEVMQTSPLDGHKPTTRTAQAQAPVELLQLLQPPLQP